MNRGEKVYAKNTEMNRSCGIRAGDRGFIAHIAAPHVSFYLERRDGYGYMEATCPLEIFAGNFASDWRLAGLKVDDLADCGYGNATDLAYATSRLYPKQFPDNFRL